MQLNPLRSADLQLIMLRVLAKSGATNLVTAWEGMHIIYTHACKHICVYADYTYIHVHIQYSTHLCIYVIYMYTHIYIYDMHIHILYIYPVYIHVYEYRYTQLQQRVVIF